MWVQNKSFKGTDACLLEHDISSESFEKLKERWEKLKKREVQS